MQTTGSCGTLLLIGAITKWFLMQHPLCDQFHPLAASNLQDSFANQMGIIYFSQPIWQTASCHALKLWGGLNMSHFLKEHL